MSLHIDKWSSVKQIWIEPWLIINGWWRFSIALQSFSHKRCLSNHSSWIVSLFQGVYLERRPFKVFNMWTIHGSFPELVRSWAERFHGTAEFILLAHTSKASIAGPQQRALPTHLSTGFASKWGSQEGSAGHIAWAAPTGHIITTSQSPATRRGGMVFLPTASQMHLPQAKWQMYKVCPWLVKKNNKRNTIVALKAHQGIKRPAQRKLQMSLCPTTRTSLAPKHTYYRTAALPKQVLPFLNLIISN